MRYPAFLFINFVSFAAISALTAQEKQQLPSFDYEVARTHELKPHRRSIRLQDVQSGFNQLRLTLTVSPSGHVVAVTPNAEPDVLKFWSQMQSEVRTWKFSPFEQLANRQPPKSRNTAAYCLRSACPHVMSLPR